MEDTKKTELFERMPVWKAVLTLSIPTVVSSLVMILYNLADTYFVGMLNNSVQNAAVTLAAPVLLAFNAVNNLFGVGSSSMMSRALGRKDYDTVHKSSAFGFWCAVVCGVLFSAIVTIFKSPLLTLLGADPTTVKATEEYLFWTTTCGAMPAILNVVMAHLVRSEGAALHASLGTMSGCLLNIILDPIFILPGGLNMGAAGAGLATFLSNCVACLYFFVFLYVKRKSTNVCIDPRKFSFDGRIVGGVCAVGVPASIQNLLNVVGMTVLNNLAADYTANAIAAMGIAQKINQIPFHLALGLSQAIMPIISYNYASGNTQRMKKTLVFSSKISLIFLVGVAVCYYAFAPQLIRAFMNNDAIVSDGARFLRGFCFGLPFICMDFIAVGVFQACGFGKMSLIFAIMRKVVLEIPLQFLLNFIYPLYGLAYSQFIAEAIVAAAALVVLFRLFRSISVSETRG